ncbi:hypothetical protein GPX89_06245 [Nocardia sp. ET3-3]|uniref:Uncharacterized protein n=1 Tax=Nocardia terrae TaxID=2675851 RepID=A0A7K1UR71_9NOCA|nr:hypothetical protein [Nocardia terrae]MVU76846.1 hypothetical protein [Nocardia terrae]
MTEVVAASWKIRWQFDRYDDEHRVEMGAVAVLPGVPARLLVTEEWTFTGLKSDNTFLYLTDDSVERDYQIMFKYPMTEPRRPRIELLPRGGGFVALVNTSRGVSALNFDGAEPISHRIEGDTAVLDFASGFVDGRAVVMVAADGWDSVTLATHDLETGCVLGGPEELLFADRNRQDWRVGRWHGAPVVGLLDPEVFPGSAAAQYFSLLDPCTCCEAALLAVTDVEELSLVVTREHGGLVQCYAAPITADPDTEPQPYGAPMTDVPGTVHGARPGYWRALPAVVLWTDAGISLRDLATDRWICHVPLASRVHDVAITSDGALAAITEHGPRLIEIGPWP